MLLFQHSTRYHEGLKESSLQEDVVVIDFSVRDCHMSVGNSRRQV
jgi:hypothetical protein